MVLLASGIVYAAPVGVTATDQDSLQVDVNGNAKVNKGDTIRHTITIQSNGGDSTGMNFSETIDANTTLVGGSVSASPVAVNDTFPVTVIGNVSINSATLVTPFSVTSNDFFGLNPPATIIAYDATSAQGGQVVMNASGMFTYNPPPGFEGSDTFTYTLGNSVGSSTGTVTITVSGMIWFVNNNAAACTTLAAGCGRLSNPFSTLAAFNALNDGIGNNPADNDTIFMYESATSYTGGVTLRSGQKLIGQDSAASLQAITGLTAPTGSATLPVMNPAAPATTMTNTGGNGVTLNSGNTLNGFTAGNASGSAISGSGFGTLTVADVIVNTTGQALTLTNGTLAALFSSVTSSGGANNIALAKGAGVLAGTLTISGGALSGATGNSFDVNGGTATISYAGTIASGSAHSVSVTGRTGGTMTFSGAITDTDTGITLTTNTGATINFTGGLSLSTGANPAFTATGGGTVNATQNNTSIINTLTTTTGTALNVANTTIGASGLTFRSISSNGGSNTGIILNTTGSSGGLTVTGTGSAGSGGTIANKTGSDGSTAAGIGIYLNSTTAVQLNWMQLNDLQNFGIRGNNVAGFTLANTVINGTNGNAASLAFPENYGEGSVYFGNATTTGLTGVASITNCTISGGRARNLSVVNSSGTLNRLTITGTNFNLNQNAADANQSIAVEARTGSNPVMNVTVTGSTFTGAPSDLANFTGQVNTTMDVIFQNNTLSNNHAWNIISGGGLTLATGGVMTLNVSGNTLRDADGSAITLQLAAPLGGETTSLDGTLNNNTIGVNAIANSGSKSGNGIFFSFADNVIAPKGQVTLAVTNNNIYQYAGNAAIYADNTGGNYDVNLTITGNIASSPNTNVFAGLALTAGAPSTGDDIDVCANITGNNFSIADPNDANDIILGVSGIASSMRLPGYSGSSETDVQNFVLANNNVAGTVVFAYSDIGPAGFIGGAACVTPSH